MRILLFADLHIGAIKDIAYVYNTVTDIIEKEVVMTKTDMVVILGDYFDRLFKVNEEYVVLAINVMSYLIRSCQRSKTALRFVYGTESHEMNSYTLFNYHLTSSDIDVKVIHTATAEEYKGKKILYLPEEYMEDKKKFYKKLLYSDNHYDYIFGHGVIVDGMPSNVKFDNASKGHEKQVPLFKSGELANVANITVFGHYHCKTDMGSVHYLGSLFRWCFGEEIPKYYGIINDDELAFVENEKAYIYKTYEFDEKSDVYNSADNLLREIKNIKNENHDVFNEERVGKIRIIFHLPIDCDVAFKENLRTVLMNDRIISTLLKESNADILADAAGEASDEYDFILDNSMKVADKLFTYINKLYDNPMSLTALKKYINEPLEL
jgi:DNA repair exonuclease SbcCD nuclease subunit